MFAALDRSHPSVSSPSASKGVPSPGGEGQGESGRCFQLNSYWLSCLFLAVQSRRNAQNRARRSGADPVPVL
jgi:hypothetical protein